MYIIPGFPGQHHDDGAAPSLLRFDGLAAKDQLGLIIMISPILCVPLVLTLIGRMAVLSVLCSVLIGVVLYWMGKARLVSVALDSRDGIARLTYSTVFAAVTVRSIPASDVSRIETRYQYRGRDSRYVVALFLRSNERIILVYLNDRASCRATVHRIARHMGYFSAGT